MTPTDKMVEAAAKALFDGVAVNNIGCSLNMKAALTAFLDELEKENWEIVQKHNRREV